MPKVQSEDLKLATTFDNLPFDIRKQANDILSKYVTTVVNSHPLSAGLKKLVIKETINEVATAMHGVMGLALTAYIQQGELSLTDTDRTAVKDLLGKVMALPSLQHEIVTYVHMLLTYLFSRYHSPSTVAASSNLVIKQATDAPSALESSTMDGTGAGPLDASM